jgi:hypothetical protein
VPDLSFDSDGRVRFTTRHHGKVSLSRKKWDLICSQPERYFYRLNGEKVAATLMAPDFVRFQESEPSKLFYYK